MRGFNGFPQKSRLIKVPGLFFQDLLPDIDSLPELKVTLYCFWRLQQKEGQITFLHKREIQADENFLSGLAAREDQREAALDEGLELAVARGTLLHVHVGENGRSDDLYFINTPKGRAAVEGIEAGTWLPDLEMGVPLHAVVERPNIFRLYEQNIGPLTPLIADHLTEIESQYPQAWIEEAIRIAVKNNVRKLNYVERILERWHAEGRGEQQVAGDENRFTRTSDWDEIES
jgi:DnaD/phage-associated family protein